MEKKEKESSILNKEEEEENIILHQTAEDIISEFDGVSHKNLNLSNIEENEKENDLNNRKEILAQENSLADKISEKLSSIGRVMKMEKI